MTLENIKTELTIRTLKARHLRAVDIGDWDYFGALLTEDFVLDLSAAVPVPVMRGRATAVAAVSASANGTTMVHHAHQPEFTFVSSNEVRVIWAMQDRIVRGPEQPSLAGFGHHHDRWVKQQGEWRLAEQRLTRLHVDVLPPATRQPNTGDNKITGEPQMINDLQIIADWLALSEAKARYCRCLDTKDWDGFKNLMTEDFELDLSGASHLGVTKGRDAAVAQIRGSIETAKTAHQVHTPEIAINGDEATVIWPMQDRVLWGDDKPSLVGYGHYNERWVRQDGQWKLAAQRLTRLHMDFLPAKA